MFFLANDDIYAQYNDTIKQAENELVLVTPWYQPTGHFKANIEDLLRDDVILRLITRPKDKNNLKHKKSIEELEELVRNLGNEVTKKEGGFLGIGAKKVEKNRLRLTYVPELHAKMVIADDKIAVLSSSNILEASLSSNYEAGILVDKNQEDYECNYSENFLDDALSFVEMMEQKFSDTQVPRQDDSKKCSSCGKPLWNPNYEFCFDCYKLKHRNVKQLKNYQISCRSCNFSYHNGGNKCPIEIHRMANDCTYYEEVASWKKR